MVNLTQLANEAVRYERAVHEKPSADRVFSMNPDGMRFPGDVPKTIDYLSKRIILLAEAGLSAAIIGNAIFGDIGASEAVKYVAGTIVSGELLKYAISLSIDIISSRIS